MVTVHVKEESGAPGGPLDEIKNETSSVIAVVAGVVILEPY